jgi:hypothetical protein
VHLQPARDGFHLGRGRARVTTASRGHNLDVASTGPLLRLVAIEANVTQ